MKSKAEYVKVIGEIASSTRDKAEGLSHTSVDMTFGVAIGHEIASNIRNNPHLDDEQAALALESFGYYIGSAVCSVDTPNPELEMMVVGIVCAVAELLGV